MNTAERLEMLDWVLHLKDEAKLQKLRELKADVKPYTENEIVGYTAVGEPMNIDQYKARLEEGKKDYEEGRFTSHEDFLREIDNW